VLQVYQRIMVRDRFLTQVQASFKKDTMLFAASGKRAASFRRLTAAGLFLFVFFIPLHFHSFASEAQIAKECSCLRGNRTQLASAPAPTDWVPSPFVSFFSPSEPQGPDRFTIARRAIRAPPPENSL